MNNFSYPYAYGKLETSMYFLASNMLAEGIISQDQEESIRKFIQERIENIKKETEKYSNS
jgi:hypothetical protein